MNEWKAALERYNREWLFIIEGRDGPPEDAEEFCTIRVLVNEFLNSKRAKLNRDELAQRTFGDYHRTCERLVNHFGKDRRIDALRPADFEKFRSAMAVGFGVVTLKNEINRCRVIFKYASDNRLIDRPVHYGSSFAKPADASEAADE